MNTVTASDVGREQVPDTTRRQACSRVATLVKAAPTVLDKNCEMAMSRELATTTTPLKSRSGMPASGILRRKTNKPATIRRFGIDGAAELHSDSIEKAAEWDACCETRVGTIGCDRSNPEARPIEAKPAATLRYPSRGERVAECRRRGWGQPGSPSRQHLERANHFSRVEPNRDLTRAEENQ